MKLKLTSLLLTIVFSKILTGQSSTDIISYINSYKGFAISEMQRTGIPASIILAQGIHETEAGTSELVRQSNNHFGIKCKDDWSGSVVYHDDDASGECFRSYTTALDSYKDHSDFLRKSARYGFLFRLNPMDYEAWARGLKKAGYATNPKYSQILIKLIRDYDLQQYTLIAMGKLNPSDEILTDAESDNHSQADTNALAKKTLVVQQYPSGEFSINNTRVIFAKAGISLLSLSNQYSIPLSRLVEFNDLQEEDILIQDQLIYLQRKRKTGAHDFHLVQNGETLYDICQTEAIRYEAILILNQLSDGEEPAPGEKIYLRARASARPLLASEKYRQPIAPASLPFSQDLKQSNSAKTDTLNKFTHIVQTNETLYSISKKYGVEMDQLQKWNKLDSLNLRKGQELVIYKN